MPPDSFLTHYYHDEPFRSLSELGDAEAADVVAAIGKTRSLPRRLTDGNYLSRRREIERRMRGDFIAVGGKPEREHPHYFIVGRSPIWDRLARRRIEVSLQDFDAATVSLTWTDSFYTYSPTTLGGLVIPDATHRRCAFRLDQLPELLERFALPPGYDDPHEQFDVYVEAQLWADPP